jgi:hypothetical protein
MFTTYTQVGHGHRFAQHWASGWIGMGNFLQSSVTLCSPADCLTILAVVLSKEGGSSAKSM